MLNIRGNSLFASLGSVLLLPLFSEVYADENTKEPLWKQNMENLSLKVEGDKLYKGNVHLTTKPIKDGEEGTDLLQSYYNLDKILTAAYNRSWRYNNQNSTNPNNDAKVTKFMRALLIDDNKTNANEALNKLELTLCNNPISKTKKADTEELEIIYSDIRNDNSKFNGSTVKEFISQKLGEYFRKGKPDMKVTKWKQRQEGTIIIRESTQETKPGVPAGLLRNPAAQNAFVLFYVFWNRFGGNNNISVDDAIGELSGDTMFGPEFEKYNFKFDKSVSSDCKWYMKNWNPKGCWENLVKNPQTSPVTNNQSNQKEFTAGEDKGSNVKGLKEKIDMYNKLGQKDNTDPTKKTGGSKRPLPSPPVKKEAPQKTGPVEDKDNKPKPECKVNTDSAKSIRGVHLTNAGISEKDGKLYVSDGGNKKVELTTSEGVGLKTSLDNFGLLLNKAYEKKDKEDLTAIVDVNVLDSKKDDGAVQNGLVLFYILWKSFKGTEVPIKDAISYCEEVLKFERKDSLEYDLEFYLNGCFKGKDWAALYKGKKDIEESMAKRRPDIHGLEEDSSGPEEDSSESIDDQTLVEKEELEKEAGYVEVYALCEDEAKERGLTELFLDKVFMENTSRKGKRYIIGEDGSRLYEDEAKKRGLDGLFIDKVFVENTSRRGKRYIIGEEGSRLYYDEAKKRGLDGLFTGNNKKLTFLDGHTLIGNRYILLKNGYKLYETDQNKDKFADKKTGSIEETDRIGERYILLKNGYKLYETEYNKDKFADEEKNGFINKMGERYICWKDGWRLYEDEAKEHGLDGLFIDEREVFTDAKLSKNYIILKREYKVGEKEMKNLGLSLLGDDETISHKATIKRINASLTQELLSESRWKKYLEAKAKVKKDKFDNAKKNQTVVNMMQNKQNESSGENKGFLEELNEKRTTLKKPVVYDRVENGDNEGNNRAIIDQQLKEVLKRVGGYDDDFDTTSEEWSDD